MDTGVFMKKKILFLVLSLFSIIVLSGCFFKRSIILSFETNGGSDIEDLVVVLGEEIDLPDDPVKTGYNFEGWYLDIDLNTPFEQQEFSENFQLYAKWSLAKFVVVWDTCGGNEIADSEFAYRASVTMPATPIKEGYVFGGWYLEESYQNLFPTDSLMPAEDLHLYARWSKGEFKVHFDSLGGTQVPLITGLYGEEFTRPNDPSKVGYQFGGWFIDSELTTEFTEFVIQSEDITLYAKWIPNDITVIFVKTEGDTIEVTVKYNEKVERPSAPERPGYDFVAWKVENSEGNLVDFDFNLPIFGPVTLQAEWAPKTYTIEFESNGGDLVDPISKPYLHDVDLPSIERTGYLFTGWYVDQDLETKVNLKYKMPLDGITLYAGWEAQEFEISFFESEIAPIRQKYLSDLVAPQDPKKLGYEFLGWYEDSAYQKPFEFPEKMPAKNYTLYAKWQTLTYNISYNLSGGEVSGNPTTYDIDSNFVLKNPLRTGYTFIGWTGNGLLEPELNVAISKGSTGNLEYQAHWELNYYSFFATTFSIDQGSVEITVSGVEDFTNGQTLAYNTLITLKALPAIGYRFVAWYEGASQISEDSEYSFNLPAKALNLVAHFAGEDDTQYFVEYYLDSLDGVAVLKDKNAHFGTTGTSVEADILEYSGFTLNPEHPDAVLEGEIAGDGTLVLKVYYSRNKYTLTFKDGDNFTQEEVLYESELEFITLTKAGYRFLGWEYNEEHFQENDSFTMPNHNLEFVADWLLENYSISYYDGINKLNLEPLSYDVHTSVNLPQYTKTGYSFQGWYLNSDFSGEEQETIPLNSIGDRVYYAKLSANEYFITYKFNEGTLEGYPLVDFYTYNQVLVLSDYEISGYLFEGWFLDSNLTPENKVTKIEAGEFGDIILYGKFTPARFDLTFYNDNASPIVTVLDLPYDSPITLEEAMVGRVAEANLLIELNTNILIFTQPTLNFEALAAYLLEKGSAIAAISTPLQIALYNLQVNPNEDSINSLISTVDYELSRISQALNIRLEILKDFKNKIEDAIGDPSTGTSLFIYTYAVKGALTAFSTQLASRVTTWLASGGSDLDALSEMFSIADLEESEAQRIKMAFPDYQPYKEGYYFAGWRLGSETVYLGKNNHQFNGLQAYVPASSGLTQNVKLVAVFLQVPSIIPTFDPRGNSLTWNAPSEEELLKLYNPDLETYTIEYEVYIKDDENNISLLERLSDTNTTLDIVGHYGVIVVPVIKIYRGDSVYTVTANLSQATVVDVDVKQSEVEAELTSSGQYYHQVTENGQPVFYFFSNTEITFKDANFQILSGSEYLAVKNADTLVIGSQYTTSDKEVSFTFKAAANGPTYKGRVYPYISQFNLGSNLVNYQNTMDNIESSLYFDKNPNPYLVGKAFYIENTPTIGNGFYFPLLVKTTGGKNISLEDSMLVYKVYRLIDGQKEEVTVSANTSGEWEVHKDGRYFYFNQVGSTYQIDISIEQRYFPLALEDVITAKSFTITVNEGHNVFTNEELKLAYADLNVKSINIHSDIKAKLNDIQTYVDDGIVYPYNYSESATVALTLAGKGHYIGNVYQRIFDYTTYDNLVVNGNYFTIDGSDLPTTNYDPGDITIDGYEQAAGLDTATGYKIRNVQVSIFHYSSDNVSQPVNTVYGNVTYNNLTVLGNTKTPSINFMDGDDQIQEAIELMGRNSGGYVGFSTFYNAQMNTNNLVVGATTIAVKSGSGAHIIVDRVHIYNTWANSIYGHGTEYLSLSNSIIETSGGAAIHLEDIKLDVSYAQRLDFDTSSVTINNWVSGEESWFKAYTMEIAAMKIKSSVNDAVKANLGRVLRTITDLSSGLVSRKMNFALLILPGGEVRDGKEGTEEDEHTDIGHTDYIIRMIQSSSGLYPYEVNLEGESFVYLSEEIFPNNESAIPAGEVRVEQVENGESELGPMVLTNYIAIVPSIPTYGTGIIIIGLDMPLPQ